MDDLSHGTHRRHDPRFIRRQSSYRQLLHVRRGLRAAIAHLPHPGDRKRKLVNTPALPAHTRSLERAVLVLRSGRFGC